MFSSVKEDVVFSLLTQLTFVFLGTLGLTYTLQALFKHLKLSKNQGEGLKAFFGTCERFVKVCLPIFGLLFALYIIAYEFSEERLAHWIVAIGNIFGVVAVSLALFKWKSQVETHLLETRQGDKSLIFAISRLLSIAIVVFATLFLLELFNYTPSTLLAFGGLGGLAVSFAAKDMIANFFGGLMIHVNRHFSVGDWIRSPNKHFEGVVEQLGWYSTMIRTLDKLPLFVPNALMTDAIIENPGRMAERHFSQTIGIRYQDFGKLEPLMAEMTTFLKGQKEIDPEKVMVYFVHFGAYSLEIDVSAYTSQTKTEEFRALQQKILLGIGKIIEKSGAEIAYPTTTIKMSERVSPQR